LSEFVVAHGHETILDPYADGSVSNGLKSQKKKKKRGHQDKINLIHIHLGAKIQHLTSKKKGKTKG
jgi:hypothetical protein